MHRRLLRPAHAPPFAHYFGFARTQWKLFLKESRPRVKPLLYVYRVLMTGVHLMRTGEVEANLLTLNETFRLPYIDDLVRQKLAAAERPPSGRRWTARTWRSTSRSTSGCARCYRMRTNGARYRKRRRRTVR